MLTMLQLFDHGFIQDLENQLLAVAKHNIFAKHKIILLYSFFVLTAAAASTCFRFIKLIINKKALTTYVEIHTTQVSCKI